MDIKFVLDFDGVLFNSAYEAYSVANLAVNGRSEYRQDVTYEEFLSFRRFVTDAWQYNRLYSLEHSIPPSMVRGLQPYPLDFEFARLFFDARKEMMAESEWLKVMPPYDFFLLLKPMLLKWSKYFAILSTRNVDSMRQALAFHGADVVQVFGQEDIRRLGSKLAIAKEQRWLDRDKWLIVYVDDMISHLEPFEGQIDLPLHADWGYGFEAAGSLSAGQIFAIISSMLAIAEKSRA